MVRQWQDDTSVRMEEEFMDRATYTNHAKAWDFVEEYAQARETDTVAQARRHGNLADLNQSSCSEAAFLEQLVQLTAATSVISVGTGNLVAIAGLVDGLQGSGQLTAVDSSMQGANAIRALFHQLSEATATSLRVVNAKPSVFLPRLNAGDYGLIVVSGEPSNYADTLAQSTRLLVDGGVIVFSDALAMQSSSDGGVVNPADRTDTTVVTRALLNAIDTDESLRGVLLPIGTGLMMAIKHAAR